MKNKKFTVTIRERALPVNQCFKIRAVGGRAMMYRSKKYIDFKSRVRDVIAEEMVKQGLDTARETWFNLKVYVHLKGGRRMDVDAPIKPTLDTLEEVLFDNDFYCEELTFKKYLNQDEDMVVIEFNEVDDPEWW